MFTESDLQYLAQRGVSVQKVEEQLASFANGFPFLKLQDVASVPNGIARISPEQADRLVRRWKDYCAEGHRVVKFVPASGAASRMFKNLFAFLDAPYDTPETDFENVFFDHIAFFAFYGSLNACCRRLYGSDVPQLQAAHRYKDIVAALLRPEGLNYGQLPKGLLEFHAYDGAPSRTPLEEHLVEGALYAADSDGRVHIHFTVSPEHRALFEQKVSSVVRGYERKLHVLFDITFSEQKAYTDTIAAEADGTPFRDARGQLVFRPGGHGALIENLNELKAEVVFIKNIDNVVPDRRKASMVASKQLLAGYLVQLQEQAFRYLRLLDSGAYSDDDLAAMLRFLEQQFFCVSPWFKADSVKTDSKAAVVDYLRGKLNRPMRVCGMVPNVGEPGGGPFLAYNPDGTVSLQILESSQIDMDNARSVALFKQGTHFNPVDLVCGTHNYFGEPFDLLRYVDKDTGFISSKSKDGRELKALELPGLWNGAMSDWLTAFVEVPLSTFNPVKTVNDLLRAEHQP
ncbi:MAG: DUF4301 family protein [Bacteroidaceae bacterium]|nr:DUF4301 family protein [Bacteroidaceae bacterium]